VSATSDTAQFANTAEVSGWAADAIEWAVGAGLITGKGAGILDLQGNATRAQVAAILQRFVEIYGAE
ncbi:MAG: S-layer homology domain-containing protein, partial [Desulfotomaculaceae bacterium]|nr:S-layer homology domain-containing protein [Desulfotomaculaceae bacterium]